MHRPLKIAIGGCVYRSMVHSSHAISLASLASLSMQHPHRGNIEVRDYAYQHTSNLPQGRSYWLRNRINGQCDMAVTVDSDTSFDAGDLIRELGETGDMDYAIGIVPILRVFGVDHRLNAYTGHGEVLRPKNCGGPVRQQLWAGGFGLAVFNLHWFRANLPRPSPEPFGSDDDWINQGEDIQMCRSVANRGGRIIPLWVGNCHFDVTHGVIGGRIDYGADGRMVII